MVVVTDEENSKLRLHNGKRPRLLTPTVGVSNCHKEAIEGLP